MVTVFQAIRQLILLLLTLGKILLLPLVLLLLVLGLLLPSLLIVVVLDKLLIPMVNYLLAIRQVTLSLRRL